MNQPYPYDPQANVLRQRAEMQKPRKPALNMGNMLSEYNVRMWNYDQHLASLPAYTPVSGWVPEVGRTYELDKDFFVRECSCKRDPENIIFHIICEKTNTGQDELCAVAVPIEQKQEDLQNKLELEGVHFASKKSFSLEDMIECWEAGKSYGIADERSQAWSNVQEPDMKQYFKSKFNIELP